MPDNICWKCIGDDVIRSEIKQEPRRTCSYCGHRRAAITLDALAQRVDPVFRDLVGPAPEGFVTVGGEAGWGPRGDYPSQILAEMLVADDEAIARDLVELLAARRIWHVHDGGFDHYDDTAEAYVLTDQIDDWYMRGWESFCSDLKHRQRFFLDTAADILDDLLGPLLRGEWPAKSSIRTIGPGTNEAFIYRGRLANSSADQAHVYAARRSALAAPPPERAAAGRMNAHGISVFYGSFDIDTCVAELRTPVGGHAVVGRFEILKPLRVLDLTRLQNSFVQRSYFAPDYSDARSYYAFLQGFHDEVRKPVLPGDEPLAYLPTQVIAEYLWARADPPFDGLIFGSAQISASSNNIVLFPHACAVEGIEEAPRELAHVYRAMSWDDPAESAPRPEMVIFKKAPEAPPPAPPDPSDWFADLTGPAEPASDDANLRLGDEDVWKIHVAGIRYRTAQIPARFEEERDWNI